MSKTVAIVGGGLAGLVAAGLIKRNAPGTRVMVIEAAANVGGLLRSFDYGDGLVFDHGTHYLAESRHAEINALMEAALPISKRHMMRGHDTDVSGVYYNGRLQSNTPFPDLRESPEKKDYISEILQGERFDALDELDSKAVMMRADEYYTARFGSRIVDVVIAPIVKKVFNNNLSDMSYVGTRFIPLGRVALLDEGVMRDVVQTPNISKVIAYPEQRNLPENRCSNLYAYYPQSIGIQKVVDGLREVLESEGVEFYTKTRVVSILCDKKKISSVEIEDIGGGKKETVAVDLLVGAAGPMALMGLLKIDPVLLRGMNKPANTAIANFKISRPLRTNGIYYFYCYDSGFSTFRVTDYRNYCPSLKSEESAPVSMEMVFHGDVPQKKDILSQGFAELGRMGVLEDDTTILFEACEILPYGFPSLTTKNMQAFNGIRAAIAGLELENLFLCGALSEPDVYFQNDILNDTFKKAQTIIAQLAEDI